jgi:EAL domain-containing protein (putative c-di-GMP-specific phosphodiesterase class I)
MLMSPGALTFMAQPIMARDGNGWRTHALEILVRGPALSNFASADVLFEYVRRKRAECEIDRLCVKEAMAVAGGIPKDVAISLNVHASTLGRDAGFVEHLLSCSSSAGVPYNRLIIELVEHAPPWDTVKFKGSVAALRLAGVRIALDDVGMGHSNFKMMLDCEPDYMKLDRYIVHRCAHDLRRQAVVESIALLAGRFNAAVIAEGVEETADIEAISRAGVDLIQGFYFSKPQPLSMFCGGWPAELRTSIKERRPS